MNQFFDKSDEKVACEKTYQLNLMFYNTDRKRKMSFDIFLFEQSCLQISFAFVRKISFKTALEYFGSVSESNKF